MFEGMTYEVILNDVIKNAPKGIDTREGSIFYDAVSGICLMIAMFYADLDLIVTQTSILTAEGEALDTKAAEYGIKRLQPTKAKYNVSFEGTVPKIGERFFAEGQYFVLCRDEDTGTMYLEAETPGIESNNIYNGTPAIPVNTIQGLISATFGDLYESGTEAESDGNLRQRVLEKISGTAENGNKQHYKTWCEGIDGVGRARIFPLWNGENTVKAVLIDGAGKPCGEAKVREIQEYIDPADKGMTVEKNGKIYTVGDGLGNGVANIGAHFTAVAASPKEVTVSFKAEIARGSNAEAVKEEAEEAITTYLRDLVLNSGEEEQIVVRINAIGAILTQLKSMTDYESLMLNEADSNIEVGDEDVPVMKEVVVTE